MISMTFWYWISSLSGQTVFAESTEEVIQKLGATMSGSSCRYSRSKLTEIESKRYQSQDFSTNDMYQNDWMCLEILDHLNDDGLKKCTPDPDQVFNLTLPSVLRIHGKMTYHFGGLPNLGFRGASIEKLYNYEMAHGQDDKTHIRVKIHFTGAPLKDPKFQTLVQSKLDAAAEIWTRQSPKGSVIFHFLSVENNQDPGFTVEIKKKANGDLYDTYWDKSVFEDAYGPNTIAHELGHMMGIPDEYDPVRSVVWQVKDEVDTMRCNIRNVMCNAFKGKMDPYYYYLIMRRAKCTQN